MEPNILEYEREINVYHYETSLLNILTVATKNYERCSESLLSPFSIEL